MLKKIIKLQTFCCLIFLNQITLNSDLPVADPKPTNARVAELKASEDNYADDEWSEVDSPALNLAAGKPVNTMSAHRAFVAYLAIEKTTKADIDSYALATDPTRRRSITKTSEDSGHVKKVRDFSEEHASNDSGFESDSDKSCILARGALLAMPPVTPHNTPKGPSNTPFGDSHATPTEC